MLFFDYQYLLSINSTLIYMLVRWIIQISILIFIILLKTKLWVKICSTLIILAFFIYNEEYRPLRPFVLNSFIENHSDVYYSLINNSYKFPGLQELTPSDSGGIILYKTNENLTYSDSQNLELSVIMSKLNDISISKVIIEDNNFLFCHGKKGDWCGMIYYGSRNYHEFNDYKESYHIQINKEWSYYGVVEQK